MDQPLWQALLDERFATFTHQFNELSHETRVEIVQVSWFFRGQSLLHVACDKAASDVVSLLLRTMADTDIPNNQREALLWVQDMNCMTPLHYACRKQSTDIVRQLLYPPWPSEDGTCRVPQTIPSTVTTTLLATNSTPEIMRLLLQHSRGNPLYGFSDFNAVFPSCRLPESSLEHAVPIVVLGEKNAGKSTIIKSLQIEGAWARLLYLFKNVSGVAQHKGGVIPTQAPEHSYLGKVVFFELSSNREFVREAILEIGHLVDAVFIIVINTKEEIDVMTEQMVIWAEFVQEQMKKANSTSGTSLQPNVIIIGSHRDVLPLGRWAAPNERFLLAYHKAMAKAPLQNCNILSHYTMDFRKSTIEVHLIQSKLHRELQLLRRHRPLLPSISYVLYSVISDLCEQKKEKAITLHELLQELTNASSGHCLLLPQDAGELLEYCEHLKQFNIILVLKDEENIENSWIMTDPLPLVAEIEEAVFTNTNDVIPAYHTMNSDTPVEDERDLSSSRLSLVLSQQSTGIMERGELERKFHSVTDPTTTDTDLLIKVMKHFKYADEILLPQTPPKPDRPCFYIPHLLPRKLDYENWHFNDPEYTYMGTWAMIPDKFLYFMPHHVHQLLLGISLSDVVPLHSGCRRTLGSFSWLDPSDGVQVFISDHNSQALVLNMRCFKGNEIKCLKQRSAIIMKIRSLIAQIDCDFTVSEIMVPHSRVECTKFKKSMPILNPLHHDLWHCKMEDIRNSIKEGKEGVLTHDSTNMVKVNDLLHFEPYCRLLKMSKELNAPLGNPASNDLLGNYFVIQLLQALGSNGEVDRSAHQLFLDIVGSKSSMLQRSDDPMAIASDVSNKGLTYSQLRKHLDSICVLRYNELQ